ncbi:MAG: hypothetical protein LBG20_03290 [Holosporaceae bacterium]|nr:hypothetical protein [Holosporaceae bacterium]
MVYRILGHEKNEALLARALTNGKIFPTWIFHGPPGIGKSGIAFKFAKCLLVGTERTKETLDVAPDNPVHGLVDQRIHPDFFLLEQTNGSVSIDDTRKLLMKIRKTPALSGWRVVILENSSGLNKNICNSLLKMLEEPPANTAIIMICNQLGTIPRTLLSRASLLCFHPLREPLVKQILEEKQIKNPSELARLAEGSVGYALRLNENDGISIYNNILNGFSMRDNNSHSKTLKWIIENNVHNHFEIIKMSLLRILKIYIDALVGIAEESVQEEAQILRPLVEQRRAFPDLEIKKVQEIIDMIYRCEPLMLDKNAVIVCVFGKFFGEI